MRAAPGVNAAGEEHRRDPERAPCRTGCSDCWPAARSSTIPMRARNWCSRSSASSKRRSCFPLDLIFELADNLEGVTKGEKLNAQLAARLAARVADIQLPRNSMTGAEKNAMAFGYYVDKHIDDERKLNFRAHDRQGRERSGKAEGHSRTAGARRCATRSSAITTFTTRRRARRS